MENFGAAAKVYSSERSSTAASVVGRTVGRTVGTVWCAESRARRSAAGPASAAAEEGLVLALGTTTHYEYKTARGARVSVRVDARLGLSDTDDDSENYDSSYGARRLRLVRRWCCWAQNQHRTECWRPVCFSRREPAGVGECARDGKGTLGAGLQSSSRRQGQPRGGAAVQSCARGPDGRRHRPPWLGAIRALPSHAADVTGWRRCAPIDSTPKPPEGCAPLHHAAWGRHRRHPRTHPLSLALRRPCARDAPSLITHASRSRSSGAGRKKSGRPVETPVRAGAAARCGGLGPEVNRQKRIIAKPCVPDCEFILQEIAFSMRR